MVEDGGGWWRLVKDGKGFTSTNLHSPSTNLHNLSLTGVSHT